MNKVNELFKTNPTYINLIKSLNSNINKINVACNVCTGAFELLISSIIEDYHNQNSKILILSQDESLSTNIYDYLNSFGINTDIFNNDNYNFDFLYKSKDIEFKCINVLNDFVNNKCRAIITSIDTLLLPVISPNTLIDNCLELEVDNSYNYEDIVLKLTEIGYDNVEIIENKGQFSRRGDIIDVFPINSDLPYRIEFFDDLIDSINTFSIVEQRRISSVNKIKIIPASNLIKNNQLSTLLNYYDNDSLVFLFDLNKADSLISNELEKTKESILNKEYITDFTHKSIDQIIELLSEKKLLIIDNNNMNNKYKSPNNYYYFNTQNVFNLLFERDVIFNEINNYISQNYKIVIIVKNDFEINSICERLENNNIYPAINSTEGKVNIIKSCSIDSFRIVDQNIIFLSNKEKNILKKVEKKHSKSNNKNRIFNYLELNNDDYVVHYNYGIGQYKGIENLLINGFRKDYLKIQFYGNDLLYLPVNQLDSLTRYINNGEYQNVKLSKLGSSDWVKVKKKASESAKQIAKELISIYSHRLKSKGYSFAEDDEIENEFADSFEFDETQGQLQAISEIKRDMQSAHPMDRLLCGDVGYGKTEVALRAAFKAIKCGKQVAILAPTTLLVYQHYETVLSRMRNYPVNVSMVSGFNSDKKNREELNKLSEGKIDIIIGTHRLLSKDVAFYNLGLLIIDEEHQFGVMQKDILRKKYNDIDVLTLSATPIPRTMSMSLSGIRDISMLDEAPEDRLPVQTFVLEYDKSVITGAIQKELNRKGQVFYLCNDIDKLYKLRSDFSLLFSDYVLEVGHGQMNKNDLSDIWRRMSSGEIDILFCTTIIGAGIDVPNANTIIVENADCFGLAQLHQIRGRVGRSFRQAYAYLTYPYHKSISELAEKRLDALKDFTEFGSGFRIAIKDLELRGAGSILGADQHGHVNNVGYEMYMHLLNEAILEEKGELKQEYVECTIDYLIDAYISESYIKSPSQRIEFYKKISMIKNENDMSDICDELIDRYGYIPNETYNLIKISLLRYICSFSKINKLSYNNIQFSITSKVYNSDYWDKILSVQNGFVRTIEESYEIKIPFTDSAKSLDFILNLIGEYNEKKNNCNQPSIINNHSASVVQQ